MRLHICWNRGLYTVYIYITKHTKSEIMDNYTPENQHVPWKSMVGRCISYWTDPFLGDMLVFGRVHLYHFLQLLNLLLSISFHDAAIIPLVIGWIAPTSPTATAGKHARLRRIGGQKCKGFHDATWATFKTNPCFVFDSIESWSVDDGIPISCPIINLANNYISI